MKTKNFLKEAYTVGVIAGLTAFMYVVYNSVMNLIN